MSLTYTDEQLLEQVKKGNNDAFEVIYLKWNTPLYLYLLNLLHYQKDDAEQVLSDVFLALYEYTLKNSIQNVKSFLYRTAHNRALDLMKKKSESYPEEIEIQDQYDVERKNAFSLSYEQGILAKYLAALPVKEREIVYLYYHDDKSYDEIAEIVETNKNTVGTLLSQAKKRIHALALKEGTVELFTI